MRWKLLTEHYLNVVGTEWEYRETGSTGRQKRMTLPVPQYLDPRDPADHTHRELEAIIVAHSSTDPRDLIFVGPPTPDMEPLDDEARELSRVESAKWEHPIETLAGNGDGLIETFTQEMAKFSAGRGPSSPIPGPTMDQFNALQEQLATLAAQNAALVAQLSAEPAGERRR